jgi:hypothetical protein
MHLFLSAGDQGDISSSSIQKNYLFQQGEALQFSKKIFE